MSDLCADAMISERDNGALFSDDHQYRYRLWRIWDETLPRLCYIMLNPSTADAEKDDATIRVCKGRAIRMSYGGIDVVNLFALRATNPLVLYRHPAPISHPTDQFRSSDELIKAAQEAGMVICAWGKHGAYRDRGRNVLLDLKGRGIRAHALKLNADGSPAHPLRISYDVQPVEIN